MTYTIGEKEINRYFLINEQITESALTEIIKDIHATNDFDDEQEDYNPKYIREPIKIVVETYGGDVYSGMSLVNTITTSNTPIFTYSYGKTMSMGVPIFAAGHLRFAHPNTSFMYHDMITGAISTLEDVRNVVEESERLLEVVNGFLLSNSNIDIEIIEEHRKIMKDWFFSGKEAFDMGLVDVLLEGHKRDDLKKTYGLVEEESDNDKSEAYREPFLNGVCASCKNLNDKGKCDKNIGKAISEIELCEKYKELE